MVHFVEYASIQSSPRPWRCFLISKALTSQMKVFSTSVEVFPLQAMSQRKP